jgi:excisionase family DNA binding protein
MASPTEIVVRLRLEYPAGVPQGAAMAAADSGPLLYRVGEVAALLAVGQTIIWDLIGTGELASVTIRRSRRVTRADLEDYVRRLAAQARDSPCDG